jgi:hypothetical protein
LGILILGSVAQFTVTFDYMQIGREVGLWIQREDAESTEEAKRR